MDLFVGNLPFELDDEGLKNLVKPYAKVQSAKVIREKGGGSSRGFGFVTVPGDEAKKVMAQLKGQFIGNKAIYVKEARPKKKLPERSFISREWREKAAEKE